jgi:hypothetical protein
MVFGVIVAVLSQFSASAGEPPRSENAVARVNVGPTNVDWMPTVDYERLTLVVVGPEGFMNRQELAADQTPSLGLVKADGERLPDGIYRYELRLLPRTKGESSRTAAKTMQRGTFLVRAGSFVVPSRPGAKAASPSTASALSKAHSLAAQDSVIPGNLIVEGNACIGPNCTSTDAGTPLTLKGPTPSIFFHDVNADSPGVPARYWQLEANENYPEYYPFDVFFLQDATAEVIPFSVQGGAPDDALVVGSNGYLGIGTALPLQALHVVKATNPTLRLEQPVSPGPARIWDIGANNTELFVKDVTNSSSVPFRIKAGTPGDSLVVNSTGYVGIGTSSPGTKLHLFDNAANVYTILTVQNTGSGVNSVGTFRAQSDTAFMQLQAHGSGRTVSRFGQPLASWSELIQSTGNGLIIGTQNATPVILGTNNTNRLQIDGSTGAVTISGNLTVTGTKNFAVADPADARRALYYTALEGPEAGTYFRGTAKTTKGEAVIELPGYFARLTEPERLTVQLTPLGSWGQLYVVEKTPSRLIVRVSPGSADLEFDYLVQGVRKGYLDYQVQRPNTLPQ